MSRIGSRPLRAAVIGAGAMGRHHARLCAEIEGVNLVGVVDQDPAIQAQAEARYQTRTFSDCRSLLQAEDLDFAVIAVPTHEHFPVARTLIEHGIHVLIEKPLALNAEEARKLISLARDRGINLGVGHVERFNPAVMALKQHLEQGELGRIFQINVQRISGFPPRV